MRRAPWLAKEKNRGCHVILCRPCALTQRAGCCRHSNAFCNPKDNVMDSDLLDHDRYIFLSGLDRSYLGSVRAHVLKGHVERNNAISGIAVAKRPPEAICRRWRFRKDGHLANRGSGVKVMPLLSAPSCPVNGIGEDRVAIMSTTTSTKPYRKSAAAITPDHFTIIRNPKAYSTLGQDLTDRQALLLDHCQYLKQPAFLC